AVTILLLTVLCVSLFVVHPWWFPLGVSSFSADLDLHFRIAFWLLGGLFVIGQLALACALLSTRSRPSVHTESSHGANRSIVLVEVLWTVLVVSSLLGLHIAGQRLW